MPHHDVMRTQDPNQDLQDGVDLDSKPRLEPMRAPMAPYPRLCEAGPCQNYHRLEIQADSEVPRVVRTLAQLSAETRGVQPVPGGTAYQAPPEFHVQVNHYCYPSPGIEMPLGALPVIRCNRWVPVGEPGNIEGLREMFNYSDDGLRYQKKVEAWEAQQVRETSEAEDAEQLIALSSGKETP